MYARKHDVNAVDFTEKIMSNVRNTPLKKELIDCINDLPDEILLTIRPLFHMLIDNTSTIETISFDELTENEKINIAKADEEFARGEFVRDEDINWK